MKRGLVTIAIMLILFRAVPGPWGCGGTTGTDSGTSTTDSLGGAPTGSVFTDSDGNTVSSTTRGSTAQLRDSSDNVLLAFTTDGSVDFTNVTATRTSSKAVVHFPSSTDKEGLTGTLVMYLPCDARTNQVRVCPSATTEDETSTSCSGVLALNATTSTSGSYTWDNASTRTGTTDCQVSASVENFGTGAFGEASSSAQPALATTDFPDVSPCSDRNVLPNDADFLTAINNAASVNHIHLSYNTEVALATADGDIPAICGLEGSWDPSAVTGSRRSVVLNTFSNTLHDDFFASTASACMDGTAGICRSTFPGFNSCSLSTDEGFPAAGTFRGDGCLEAGGSVYYFRTRATVSGDGADKKFSEVSGSLSNQTDLVIFDSDGNRVETKAAVKTMATENPADFSFTVRNNIDNSITYLNVRWEVICVKHDTTQSTCS